MEQSKAVVCEAVLQLKSFCIGTELVHLSTITNSIRILRNACASEVGDILHDVLMDVDSVLERIELVLNEMLQIISDKADISSEKEQCLTVCRCALQFLGNFVSRCPHVSTVIWCRFDSYLLRLFQLNDDKLSQYTTMLLYSCLRNSSTVRDSFSSENTMSNSVQLLQCVLQLLHVSSVDWALFIVQELLHSSNFFLKFHFATTFNYDQQCLILTVIESMLAATTNVEGDANVVDKMPSVENVVYLCDFLQQLLQCVLLSASTDCPVSQSDPLVLLQILRIICAASSDLKSIYTRTLQQKTDLFEITLTALKSITLGQTEIVQKLGTNSKDLKCLDANHPFYGFKRDLVRLLANLCYKCARNAALLREADGIPCLLDCTAPDANNPFATQWAIFAVRNLCEIDVECQQVIGMLVPKGVAGNCELLERLNLTAQMDTTTGRVKIVTKQANYSS